MRNKVGLVNYFKQTIFLTGGIKKRTINNQSCWSDDSNDCKNIGDKTNNERVFEIVDKVFPNLKKKKILMKFLFSVSSYYVTLKTSQTEIRKRAVLSDDSWHPAICYMA